MCEHCSIEKDYYPCCGRGVGMMHEENCGKPKRETKLYKDKLPEDKKETPSYESYIAISSEQKLRRMEQIFNSCLEIARRKDHDYAGPLDAMSNFHDFGWKGIVVRLGDKYKRIQNFSKYNTLLVKDESIEDTLMDLINYAALCLIEKECLKK